MTKSSPTLLAALPVKDLANAKQRLMSALTPDERHDLAAAMLEDVLDALAAVEDVTVLLVTKDPEVLTLASRRGTPCLTESANRGHTEAVALGQRAAVEDGFARFLTLPGDVPCASAEEIRALIAAVGDGPGVAFVPSLSGFGTNAALLAPPGAMPLKFGEPSFANHLDAARARGLVPMILELPGIGLDVDAPEDLRLLLARGPRTRAGRLLHARGIAARLTAAG